MADFRDTEFIAHYKDGHKRRLAGWLAGWLRVESEGFGRKIRPNDYAVSNLPISRSHFLVLQNIAQTTDR